MGRYSGKSCRIVCMLVLTTMFLLVEIIVGHVSNSLALVADAFHMLSDTMALIVGLIAVKLSRKARTKYNTYGWARAEVVGALINAVFLVALTFTIFVEAVERLAMREAIEDAYLLLYVGAAGLAINLMGLLLFHNHAHGHTHGGGSHGHSHDKQRRNKTNMAVDVEEEIKISGDIASDTESESDGNASILVANGNVKLHVDGKSSKKNAKSHQLNMRGVFIHVLGDALGSVVVMISATVTILARKYLNVCDSHHHHTRHAHQQNVSMMNSTVDCRPVDPDWVLCIDPILSLMLVAIILCTALPLLKETALVLMQTVPRHLELSEMHSSIEQIAGVVSIHEFHVWNLSSDKVIASLHIHAKCLNDYLSAAKGIKLFLHEQGVHSVTIQPEFPHLQSEESGRVCTLECGPEMDCHKQTCCGRELIKTEVSCRSKPNAANSNPV